VEAMRKLIASISQLKVKQPAAGKNEYFGNELYLNFCRRPLKY